MKTIKLNDEIFKEFHIIKNQNMTRYVKIIKALLFSTRK